MENLKDTILKLRKDGLSYNAIKKELNCSKSVISYHCKNNDLNDIGKLKIKTSEKVIKEIHILENKGLTIKNIASELRIGINTVKKYKLIKRKQNFNNSERVTNWRKRMKLKAIDYKGGECVLCGYKKCIRALNFHHLDPSKKIFALSSGNTKSWEKMKIEIDKCILVCSNCHAEIHEGLINIDSSVAQW